MGRGRVRSIAVYVIILGTIMVALLALLYAISLFHIVPLKFSHVLYAIVIGVIIYAIVKVTVKYFERFFATHKEYRHLKYVTFIISLVGYFIIALAVLAALGIDVSSVILGSAFVSVVIGLAAQTVLSNVFGGLFISVVRPFNVGDQVIINTWQYGASLPSYPPKYFSRDFMEASMYRGVILDISMNYTTLGLESGDTVRIPNGIMVQAAITIRKGMVTVQARYEVPKSVPFDSVAQKLREDILSEHNAKNLAIFIDESTLNTYIMLIRGDFPGEDADPIRSSIIRKAMAIVEPMKAH
ncbi:mechanosensitive ion channel family protein [Thermoplasma sp.]|uniref:mechanosensitive ion channel family protein n=1 Tax=Thermoplasma sp. TaxID=1973142 RepID=UPI00127DE442|nr:mechanosensitive ion channel family protein [Thermoplasma sp.]KAA8923151.1 MAG: mechanosensitive ion channel family protein [Thermoplasma sp.]